MIRLNSIEIFKAGEHTDSAGNVARWSPDDISAIAAGYNADSHEAPIVIGHPELNSPAFGWIKGLRSDGGVLLADLDLVPEFAHALKEGLYKKRSIALYPDKKTVRHLGFLGGAIPAIKALKDISFNAKDNFTSYEFTTGMPSITDQPNHRGGGNMVEGKAPDGGSGDAKDNEIAALKEEVKSLKAKLAGKDTGGSAGAHSETTVSEINALKETIRNLEDETVKLKAANKDHEFAETIKKKDAELADAKTKIEGMEKVINEMQSANQLKLFAEFTDKLIAEGRLLPAQKQKTVESLVSVSGISEYTFSEGNRRPVDSVMDILAATPVQVHYGQLVKDQPGDNVPATAYNFGETVKVDMERAKQEQMATAYMNANKCTFEQAITATLTRTMVGGR